MDRAQLFDALSHLSTQDFERLLVAVNMPRMNRAGTSAKIGEQVSAFLEWADSRIGPGIDEVQDYLNKLEKGTLHTAFDFSGYLQAICGDSRYQLVRDLYTQTEVLIPLEAETVEQKSPTEDANRGAEQTPQKVERFPVVEGLRKYALGEQRQHLLLAGRPGSGKSTTLKRLLIELAEASLGQPQFVPVYVQLKGDRSIYDLIIAEFRRAKVRVTPELLDDWLLQDYLLLLLDGINEIPSDEQRRKLQEFREDNLTVPMIFTTRNLAVGGDLGIGKRLEMRPLRELQMREFVQRYLPNHADTLLRQLKDRLREVAETPLLLKMLCDVFDPATGQIPQSKGELFRLFDAKYDKFKGLAAVSEDFRRFKPELLQHLAFCMLQGDPVKPTEPWLTLDRNRAERLLEAYLTGRVEAPGQRAKEWLEDLLEHHLLQVATDPREIEFHHQLFQEYYAAEALLLKLPKLLEDEAKFKRDYLNLLKWTEAIALAVKLFGDKQDRARIIELALEVDLGLEERLADSIDKDSPQEIDNLLSQLDNSDGKDKISVINYLGSFEEIDEVFRKIKEYINSSSPEIRRASLTSLYRISPNKAKPYILSCLNIGDLHIAKRILVLAAQSKDASFLPYTLSLIEDLLIRKIDLEMVALASYYLGEIGGDNEVNILVKLTDNNNHFIKWAAAQSLGRTGSPQASLRLQRAIDEGDYDLFSLMVDQDFQDVEDFVASAEMQSFMLSLLNHKNSKTRESSAIFLGRLGDRRAIPYLINILDSNDPFARGSSAEILRILEAKESIPSLLKLLKKEKNNSVIGHLLRTLGRLGCQDTIPFLVKFSSHEDVWIRCSVADAFGFLKCQEGISVLFKLLDDDDGDVCCNSAHALGGFSTKHLEVILPKLQEIMRISGDNGCIEEAIINLQSKCKFYNFEVARGIIPLGKIISLYLSYAPADKALQIQLANHITLLERQGVITSWSSHQILPGSDRTQTIHQQLNTADIILLLISPDAIADDTCYHLETQRAIERHQSGEARVIPILLRPVDWQGAPFSQLDVLPKNHQPVTTWPNQDQAFQEIAEGIRTVAMEMRREKGNSGKVDAL
ncbi:MAG: HEAT repeat domain-containing protein [Tildeniella torsiva UHER 1998/13D]|jgi:HEAT repeat protein|nr:HEAT repeat domain-containing protein [Tildeniella torsiva UHER 1998/13D]